MLKNLSGTIVINERTAEGIYRVVLHCPGIDLQHLIPGQFAHIGIPGHRELLMKRPISINDYDEAGETLTLIYQVKGQGTSALVFAGPGASMDVIARWDGVIICRRRTGRCSLSAEAWA